MREAQDPLAHGHRREHPVDQVRGPLSHAPTATARTKTAATARERYEPIQAARSTAKSREAAGQPAATEKGAELLLDESRQPSTFAQIGGLRAERFEVVADHLIQHTLGGVPCLIARRRRSHAVLSAQGMPHGAALEPRVLADQPHSRAVSAHVTTAGIGSLSHGSNLGGEFEEARVQAPGRLDGDDFLDRCQRGPRPGLHATTGSARQDGPAPNRPDRYNHGFRHRAVV